MQDWPPIVPPEPREVESSTDYITIEVYNVTKGEATQLSNKLPIQQFDKISEKSTSPYQGLLPNSPDESGGQSRSFFQSYFIAHASVYPPDDRVRITPTTSYPWRTICRLLITFPSGGQYIGSGAIIGCPDGQGNHVLTAGHCVYNPDEGGWATSIQVVPALDDGYMPYGSAWATIIRTYTGWTQYQDHRHDWAVLTLDRDIGEYTGWMGRKTADPSDPVYTGILNTAGYPGDKGGNTMWFDSDYGRTADEYNHWYYMDTYGGQSGSPVWVYYSSTGERYILAIHAYGNDELHIRST